MRMKMRMRIGRFDTPIIRYLVVYVRLPVFVSWLVYYCLKLHLYVSIFTTQVNLWVGSNDLSSSTGKVTLNGGGILTSLVTM